MPDSSVTIDMAFDILTHERFPVRFEDFCVDLFFDVDGVRSVTTSTTWDHGRDGRGVTTGGKKQPPFICCGTEEDVVKKAVGDTKRICENVAPVNVTYCFNDPAFSEHKAIRIEEQVRVTATSLEVVRSFGAHQLAQLAAEYPRAFEKHYQGELANLRTALATSSSASEYVELTGLRLALTTQLTDDAQSRRKDMIQNLVLTALTNGASVTLQEIARSISERLHLPKAAQSGWLQPEISELVQSGYLACNNDRYSITASGAENVKARTSAGTKTVIDGQSRVHDLIEKLTGHKLTTSEWQMIWSILQSHITVMFLSHGATIIESIESVVSGQIAVSQATTLREHIARIASSIASISGKGTGNRLEEIAQAVSDMFQEKSSPAFAWLTSLCEVYVHLCALGLEPYAQNQVLTHLQEIELILDTDVVLSMLCTGEENHFAVEEIIKGWKKLGGGLRVAEPVLEETSHHAWISQIDYEMTWRLFPKMKLEDAQHSIENAFVRGYWTEMARRKAAFTLKTWNSYINAFRGKRNLDYTNIEELLDDQEIEILPDSSDDCHLAKRIAEYLFNTRKGSIGTNVSRIEDLQEKSQRDGRLLAALIRRRNDLTSAKRTAYIISTSLFLRVVGTIQSEFRQSVPVLSTAAIAWLLSLAPGVRLSALSLREVLFDADLSRHLSSVERVTLRILQASEEYQCHFSRRPTLKKAIREQLAKIAAQEGVSESDVKADFLSNDAESDALRADVIANAIDSISRSKSEKDITVLHEKVRHLEELLARERQKGQT